MAYCIPFTCIDGPKTIDGTIEVEQRNEGLRVNVLTHDAPGPPTIRRFASLELGSPLRKHVTDLLVAEGIVGRRLV
jgi:hypothetical protein